MIEPGDNFETRLAAELKGLYGGPGVRGGEDERILSAARAAGEAAVRGRWKWRVGLGMAAAVAVAAGVLWAEVYRGVPGRGALPMAAAPAAVSNVRTGDIRDAYFVARGLKEHRALGAGWDANGDGVVDERDVQVLALAAVRLPAAKGDVR